MSRPATPPPTVLHPVVPTQVRRPPAAPSQWATVTRLGGPPEPAVLGQVQGALALALDFEPEAASPAAPPAVDAPGCEVQAWSARFAQAVVEVLGGDRPLGQLVRWTSHRVYADLDQRVRVLTRTSADGRARTLRPQVRSVHVFQPSPVAAEVSVHVRYGSRSRALAARLELRRGRWQCTALQLG